VATKHTTIGSGISALHLRAEDDTESTKEFSTGYHAGFEAGLTMGRQAGLNEAGEPGGAQSPAVNNKSTVASPRFLLGLPCRNCGAYYGSDEKRCPVCKTNSEQAVERTLTASEQGLRPCESNLRISDNIAEVQKGVSLVIVKKSLTPALA
jgi:hypothetical protein